MSTRMGVAVAGRVSKNPQGTRRMPKAIMLPAEGRKGRPPAWPLEDGPSPEELDVWRILWKTPQSTRWDLSWTRDIALYARWRVQLERKFTGTLEFAVRQLGDRLGMNPLAMARLRWVIADPETVKPRPARSRAAAATNTRLRAVE